MPRKVALYLVVVFSGPPLSLLAQEEGAYRPVIPKVWDDAIMRELEVPLARPEYSPNHVPASFYYQIPVRPIYKSYPVYHPDREPEGYIEWLRSREPEIAWDVTQLRTKQDWTRAGEVVFDSPLAYGSIFLTPERLANAEDLYVRDEAFHSAVRPPVAADGSLPYYRYVIRKKGAIDVGILSCGMCHTRVMPSCGQRSARKLPV